MSEGALRVYGALTDENGRELSHADVRLWQRRLRDRTLLGETKASEEGRYEIRAQWPEEGPGKVLLNLEANTDRLKTPIESGLIEAQPHLEIDLQQPPSDPSDYGVLRRAIDNQRGQVPITELVESDEHQDISFLSTEIGRTKEEIVRVVLAARLEEAYEVAAAAFFAFLRQQVPSGLPNPLLDATANFTLVDQLVQRIASLIFGLSAATQTQTLETAVSKNLIEPGLQAQIPDIVTSLQSHHTSDLLSQPYLVGKTTLSQLLTLANLPEPKHAQFAQLLATNAQSMRNFWRTLAAGESGLTSEEASAVQRTLELGAFVKNHPPLVQTLQQRFSTGQYTTLADLAKLTVADWTQLVDAAGPPPNIEPAGNATAAEVYARVIYIRVTRAYPTAALASRITTAALVPPAEQEPVNRFFTNSASLDLVKTTLSTFLEQNAEAAFAGIGQELQPTVVASVKRMQRVLRVTPDVDAAQTLLTNGFTSAAQIANLGQQQFFNQATTAGLTKVEANRVYRTAAHRYASVVQLYTQLHRDMIGLWPKAIGQTTELDQPVAQAIARDDSLVTLFGSQDYCATDECTSVLSPAAYLCDLLLWLRGHTLTGPFPTALDALFARRPDIGHLLLNCPNSETPLPYIDLVNELLENAVAPPGAPAWNQTTEPAPELRAAPEYVNAAAYQALKTADYPHTLPYDAPLDELRTILAQQNIALWQLRQALLPLHAPPQANRLSVAAERFTVDPHELTLITTPNAVSAATAWNTPAPTTDLVQVQPFLQAAGISYEQLLELIEVAWVRAGGAALTLQGLSDTCDLSIQTITPDPLDPNLLDRVHRFLRLWRHAPWRMWELDMLLAAPAVANGTLDQAGLIGLFTFRRLAELTGLAVDQLLAFYGDLDTSAAGHRQPDGTYLPSLYTRLFLDPAVPADPDLQALATGGAVTHANLSDHLPAIQAALQITAADAATLFAAPITDGQLTLANLSKIHRIVALARAAKSSLSELLRILPLTAAANLTGALASPAATLDFLDEVAQTTQSGFSNDALVYVLTTSTTAVGITDDAITTVVLPAVRAAIQQTHDEIFTSADPALTILQRELAQVPPFSDAALLAGAISIVNDTFTGNVAARNTFIAANFATFVDPATAEAELAPLAGGLTAAQRQAAVAQRANQLLAPLATYLTQTRVIAALAANLGLTPGVAALLVDQLDNPATTHTLLSILTAPHLIDKPGGSYLPLTRINFPDQFVAIDLLDKVGTVVRALRLTNTDVTWLLAHSSAYGGLDLRQLPVTGAQPPQSLTALLNTSLVVKLERLFTQAPPAAAIPDLYALIAGIAGGTVASAAAASAALAIVTGWATADISALASAVGAVFPADYTQPATFDTLHTLAAMQAAAGASATQLVSWAVPDPGPDAATSARGALEARYAHTDWLALAPKIMDPIRERRSAALQAYLIAERDGTGALIHPDADALFDTYLIDVQMSSCQVTSRVVQAYAGVQLFVERCLMGLEEPHGVTVDLTHDETWTQWKWMKRYRIWEAAREVFLYPENWLIEAQRPTRTEIYESLEQGLRQNEVTLENLEAAAENYIESLDELAHLYVTGTCEDPATGDLHVVARAAADPPRYYHRTFHNRVWSGWTQIGVDIKAHHAVPAVYRGRLCLFWLDVKVTNEPHQDLPPAEASTSAPNQEVAQYVSLGLNFSILRRSGWSPAQKARGHLFDIPILSSDSASNSRAVEELFTIKVQTPAPAPGFGASLLVDVFRLGDYDVISIFDFAFPVLDRPFSAVHIGRANFDGRFADLEQRNLTVVVNGGATGLLDHARTTYGPDADPLVPLPAADPDLLSEPNLVPKAGSLATVAVNAPTIPLTFTSLGALEQNVGELLHTAAVPYRVVGEDATLGFDPSAPFFYQDNRRCYYVEGTRYYQWGSAWLPIAPSNPATSPFELRYTFHRFYHPYTRLLWHQLAGGGFPALYDRKLQLAPDTIDPTGADVFSFNTTYTPTHTRVSWGEDNEIIDFSRDAAYSVYNWELFFHTPLLIAQNLSQNQQFEDALSWFHYIFDPTRQGPEPLPQRFWITAPLNSLTTSAILSEQINNLLVLVNHGDANAVAQVTSWRNDPFDPFLLADQRPVAYMKRVVMSYLDTLIGWADNLFSTESREALNEATLLYVLAAEILGPKPQAVTPPQHADASYDDLAPQLDAFANAMVDIENYVPAGAGGGGGGGGNGGGPMPRPQTFYFKVPPNEQLLGYWTTVADRLFKLRHCETIAGGALELPLFDAPIDPGLLVAAQAAGVDLGSVLSDLQTARPGYRFTTLYGQALDFSNSVIAYGAELLAALQQKDAQALALLLANVQQQVETDNGAVLQSQIDAAAQDLAALEQTLALNQAQETFAQNRPWGNPFEIAALSMKTAQTIQLGIAAVGSLIAGGSHLFPDFLIGVSGFGGTPAADAKEGGKNVGHAADSSSDSAKSLADIFDKGSDASKMAGDFEERHEQNVEKALEGGIQVQQVQAQILASQIRHEIAAVQLSNHVNQLGRLQNQIDFLTDMFTSEQLYDWMVGKLSATYFQAYRLAYKLCQQAERCYRYELGLTDSSFIQFGYWDSLKQGLQAGESLVLDLRRLQSSYLEQNARRFETSRFVSLAALDPQALLTLLEHGACDFDLPESLFDGDYPGQYQRRLQRVSVTVVYPNPGRFDNVKCTLTMKHNSVRTSTDLGPGYGRQGPADTRFVDEFGAVPQKIVLANGQDDPGLFLTAINDNLGDARYLPFEGAGVISSWHLELPAATNELDLSTVSDIVLHLHYTALDGGDAFQQAVQADNAAHAPNSGAMVLSAANDFASAWSAFLTPPAGGGDQLLTLPVPASKFPSWARGKTITISALTVLATSTRSSSFVARPQAPLPTADVTLSAVAGVSEPNVVSGAITPPPTGPGTWSLKLRASGAGDFHSLSGDDIGDVLLLVAFTVA